MATCTRGSRPWLHTCAPSGLVGVMAICTRGLRPWLHTHAPSGQPTVRCPSPFGADNGSYRGLRGGSFNNNDNNLHASNRNNNPTNENSNIGFRVFEAPGTQAAQACGQIRAGGPSSHGRGE